MIRVALQSHMGDFSLDVSFRSGGVTIIIGHSGAGKTSILNAVAGLIRPEAGRIVIGEDVLFDSATGVDLPVWQRRIGYVFQDLRLFPHLSVARNLTYGGGPLDAHLIELLGISRLLDRRPGTLSGGEKQRVALGRALMSRPRALLLDEPLAALDRARRADIVARLTGIRAETALPMLIVSHTAEELAGLATDVIEIENGRQIGRPG